MSAARDSIDAPADLMSKDSSESSGTRPPESSGTRPPESSGTRPPENREVNLDERIADLDRRIRALSVYIDDYSDLEIREYIRLLSLYGELVSRLGRLMRDRQKLSGDQVNELRTAIYAALDDISKEQGIKL